MNSIPADAIPKLHLTLRDTRLELERMREFARRLAVQLDAHVDAAYGGPPVDIRATGTVLYEARHAGLLDAP